MDLARKNFGQLSGTINCFVLIQCFKLHVQIEIKRQHSNMVNDKARTHTQNCVL